MIITKDFLQKIDSKLFEQTEIFNPKTNQIELHNISISEKLSYDGHNKIKEQSISISDFIHNHSPNPKYLFEMMIEMDIVNKEILFRKILTFYISKISFYINHFFSDRPKELLEGDIIKTINTIILNKPSKEILDYLNNITDETIIDNKEYNIFCDLIGFIKLKELNFIKEQEKLSDKQKKSQKFKKTLKEKANEFKMMNEIIFCLHNINYEKLEENIVILHILKILYEIEDLILCNEIKDHSKKNIVKINRHIKNFQKNYNKNIGGYILSLFSPS